LPHLDVIVDPDADDALAGLVARLRAELEQRALGGTWPELVIAAPELSSLAGCADELQLLLAGAAASGVRLVAGSTEPAATAVDPLLGSFTTRMVLHLEEEEQSVALLGVADAAFLGGGGRLLVRVDGREPVEMYGYQVPPEHLERLVRVMRSAYPSSPRAPFDLAPSAEPETVSVASESSAFDDQPTPQPVESDPTSPEEDQSLTSHEVAERSDQQIQSEAPRGPTLIVTLDAPLHVLCFGEPRVLCAGTQVWPKARGGDAKPWEFLLYLACQSIDGVTREVAVQALWPDDEVLDATHRFRQLRYRIRGALSKVDNAPVGDGISLERLGMLFLDHRVVYSDAQEFLEVTRLARIFSGQQSMPYLQRARSLFTADLVSGPGVRRYAWADERDESGVTLREHFRHRFQHATLTLAELYADAGDVDAAIATYHELIELEPGDERIWRAMFRLRAVQNDPQSLIQDERQLRAVLRELAMRDGEEPLADACEPSEETRRDFERLLARLNAPEPASSTR
jgi:DNA-binding SARP family transcriptional activator